MEFSYSIDHEGIFECNKCGLADHYTNVNIADHTERDCSLKKTYLKFCIRCKKLMDVNLLDPYSGSCMKCITSDEQIIAECNFKDKAILKTEYICNRCGYRGQEEEHECNNPDNKKPPLGIMPEYIWKEKRAMDLLETINRYVNAGWLPMSEWIEEYGRLVKEIEEKGKYKL